MENRYTWNVSCDCSNEELTAGVFNFVINETLIELIKAKIDKYSKKLDLENVSNALDILLEKNYDVGFTSFANWTINKNRVYSHLLEIVNMLDLVLAQNKKIKGGELTLEFKSLIEELGAKLMSMHVTTEIIDFGDLEPSDQLLDELVYEVGKVNEGANLKKQMFYMMLWVSLYAIVSFFCVNKVYGLIQPFVILVYPLLKMYNGERGNLNTKWLFYIYYPLHLFIIGILRILIYGNISLLF